MWSKRRQWPLHHQIIVVVSVLVLLATVVLGAYTARAQGHALKRGAQTQVSTLARNLAISSVNPILTESLDVLEELAKRSADFEDVEDIRILSASGSVLSHVRRDDDGRVYVVVASLGQIQAVPSALAQQRVLLQEEADRAHLIAWQAIEAGNPVGWVRVDYSTRSYQQLQWQVWTSTVVVSLVFVVLCAWLLIAFLKAPLAAVRQATRFAVGLKEVQGQQMSVDDSAVEVEALGGALNEASMRLHQQMLAMQRQNERLGAIFALSPDGLLTLDLLGRVEFANDAFMRLTGLAREQVEGASLSQLETCLLASAEPGTTFPGLQACFAAQTAQHLAPRLVLTQGEVKRVLTFTGLRSESSVVSGVIYVCDVTQRERLDQMKSDFLSLAAHELRTPMTSIYGFTELLMTRPMSPEAHKDMMGRVHRQAKIMVGILNELLDLARIEAKKGSDLVLQRANLAELVTHLTAEFAAPAGRQPPVIEPCDWIHFVKVDRSKLRQMLVNLLSNAYKYSPNGGDVTVSFVRESVAGHPRFGVAVKDRGMGLTPEQLSHMGERFFRADKSGHIPGTGLGVSIVKELAELMGAQLTYSSEWQKGTVATLWFTESPQDSDA
ncbi:MAG: ATP-binding protein [Aquabacterium sp.]